MPDDLEQWCERLCAINPLTLSRHFRERELHREAKVGEPFLIRLDGVNFGKALRGFETPRDPRVHRALIAAAETIVRRFNARLAYVVSDEVNVLVDRAPPYGGRVLKIVSVSASAASAHASSALGCPLLFDGRVVKLRSTNEAVAYVLFRARVGFNNYVSALYHRATGDPATPELGVMLERLASAGALGGLGWKALGSSVVWEEYVKKGVDRRTGEEVEAVRRKIRVAEGFSACIEAIRGLRRRASF